MLGMPDSWRPSSDTQVNLDTNALSGARRMIFINGRSRTQDAKGNPRLVSSVAMDAQQIVNIINEFRIGKEGYISLISAEGGIDMASDKSRISNLQKSTRFKQLLNTDKDGLVEINLGDHSWLLASIWVEDLNRFLVIELPKEELMAPIREQILKTLGLSLLLILTSLLLFYPLARSLTRPLRKAQAELGSISQTLDLGKRIQVRDKTEIGRLVLATNQLLDRLTQVIQAIQSSSGQLDEAATRLAQSTGLYQAADNGNDQQQESMAATIQQMSASVAEITSTMEEFSASSTQIAQHSESVAKMAKGTLESSERGARAMGELEQQMATIQGDQNQSITDILALGEESKAIGKVMELINALAEQTRLIAFNAALEASSAGEAGRRFSVVASEIRRLANSVSSSTKDIEHHIQDIQVAINRLVVTSEKSAKSVQAGLEVSANTAAELSSLVEAAGHTSDAALQISLSTQQQKTASSQVTQALRGIAKASASNARAMRDASQISQDMLQLARELNSLVSEFKLGGQT